MKTETIDGVTYKITSEGELSNINITEPVTGDFRIPSEIMGIEVKKIGPYIFEGGIVPSIVIVPDSVTELADSSFGSYNLSKLVIEGKTNISNTALLMSTIKTLMLEGKIILEENVFKCCDITTIYATSAFLENGSTLNPDDPSQQEYLGFLPTNIPEILINNSHHQ